MEKLPWIKFSQSPLGIQIILKCDNNTSKYALLKSKESKNCEGNQTNLFSKQVPKNIMSIEEVKETNAYKVFKDELFNLGDYYN